MIPFCSTFKGSEAPSEDSCIDSKGGTVREVPIVVKDEQVIPSWANVPGI